MIVDLVLGAIFITAIICFTVYKINKNSVDKNTSFFTDEDNNKESKETFKDLVDNNKERKEAAIGFQFKKETKTLTKEADKHDKD